MPHRPTCPTWFAGLTATRTSSTARRRRSTGSGSRHRPRRSSSRTGRRTSPARSPRRASSPSNGQDLLILDSKNVLWRWRPADDTGKGTLTKVTLQGRGLARRRHPGHRHVPADGHQRPVQPLHRRSVRAADQALHPGRRRQRLPEQADRLAGDGTRRLAHGLDLRRRRHVRRRRRRDGPLRRAARARAGTPRPRRTACCARRPVYSLVAGGPTRRDGAIYGYDSRIARVIALSKADGTYQAQYRLADGGAGWSDLRAMYIIPGTDDAPGDARLAVERRRQPVPPDRGPTPTPQASPSASPSASPGPSASPAKATPKPTKKP